MHIYVNMNPSKFPPKFCINCKKSEGYKFGINDRNFSRYICVNCGSVYAIATGIVGNKDDNNTNNNVHKKNRQGNVNHHRHKTTCCIM